EQRVEDDDLPGERVAVLQRDRERGVVTEDRTGDDRGDYTADHDGRERAGGEGAQDLLEGEEGARERGVEGGRDPGRRTRGHQHLHARGAEPEHPAEGRADG